MGSFTGSHCQCTVQLGAYGDNAADGALGLALEQFLDERCCQLHLLQYIHCCLHSQQALRHLTQNTSIQASAHVSSNLQLEQLI